MPRFHIYRLQRDDNLKRDLQADLLDTLKTRIVAPLIPVDQMPWAIAHLNPHFEVAGKQYVMATQRMAAISTAEIGPYVADLSEQHDRIVAATDFLFQGF